MKLITRLLDWVGIERERPEVRQWAKVPAFYSLPEAIKIMQKALDAEEIKEIERAKEYVEGSLPYENYRQYASTLRKLRSGVQDIAKLLYDTPAGDKALQEALQVVDWQLGGGAE